MKYKLFYVCAALSLGVIVVSGWLIWSASATAQDVASPQANQPTLVLEGISVPAPERAPVPLPPPVAVPLAPAPLGQSTIAPQYGYPSLYPVPQQYQVPQPPPGMYTAHVAQTDPETAKLVIAYQDKQREINELLQRRPDGADLAESDAWRKQLVDATAAQFDLRQQVREREVEQLKKRLTDVEKTVKERNEKKDEIVEKRVADILREPDQLGWESVDRAPGQMVSILPPASYAPVPSLPAPGMESTRFVPKVVERIIEEPIVDAKGNVKTVRRHVYDTEYAEIGPVIGESSKNALSRSQNRYSEQATEYPPMSSTNMTVAEAEARVRIAQTKRDALRRRFAAGEGESAEVMVQEGELELAKLSLARAKTEYEARTKLLELDVKHAESVHEQALVALAEAEEVNKKSPNSIPLAQVAARKAAFEQARIELERAKTHLQFHQESNARRDESPETQPK